MGSGGGTVLAGGVSPEAAAPKRSLSWLRRAASSAAEALFLSAACMEGQGGLERWLRGLLFTKGRRQRTAVFLGSLRAGAEIFFRGFGLAAGSTDQTPEDACNTHSFGRKASVWIGWMASAQEHFTRKGRVFGAGEKVDAFERSFVVWSHQDCSDFS